MKAKKIHHDNQTQSIQLKQKHGQLIEKIDEEKKFEIMLKDSMPVDLETSAKGKNDADKAIARSILFLRGIYDDDRAFTKIERQKVEQELKKLTSGIPIPSLFEAIKFHNENEMKVVDKKFASIEIIPTNDSISSAFKISVTKSRVNTYVIQLNTRTQKQEQEVLVEQYVNLYDEYLAKIVNEMNNFNSPGVELFSESICGDYLKEYGSWMCNQSLLEFLRNKLNNLQKLSMERDGLLKGNELVISELSGLYEQIEKTYNLTLDDMVSLGDINKNMKQLQAHSKYTISTYGDRSTWNTSTSMLNSTSG